MPHIDSNRRNPIRKPATTAVVLALLLACLGLAACGGSSSNSSTNANASATGSGGLPAKGATGPGAAGTGATGPARTGPGSAGTGATGQGGARFKALRECLQKNGITLPNRPPGGPSGPSGPRGFLGGAGGPQLPSGVTRAQYEAALKKCGGPVGGGFAGRRGIKNPVFREALAKFATCLRANGVNVPPPNTSGSGPIFSTKGIDTTSAQFRNAESKCRSVLASAFRRGPGTGGAGTGSGSAGSAPPSGSTAPSGG